MSHWASELIGRKWEAGAEGPKSFDCYGLVKYVEKTYFNREMGSVVVNRFDRKAVIETFKKSLELKNWKKIEWRDAPREGDAIVLSSSKEPIHIGIIIKLKGKTGVLHSERGIGVIFTPRSQLNSVGWVNTRLYRWVG